MAEWYRWNAEATAQAALDAINGNPNLPIVGVNAKTGQPQPNKQKTTKWAEAVVTCTDGKFGFPRIPAERLESLNISQAERDAFLAAFNPTIEEFDPAWIPAPVE